MSKWTHVDVSTKYVLEFVSRCNNPASYYIYTENFGITGFSKNFQYFWFEWIDPARRYGTSAMHMAQLKSKLGLAQKLTSDMHKTLIIEHIRKAFPEDF